MNIERHVIFGTGPVGMAIMAELCHKGKTVRMVNRSGKAPLPDGVELVSGDASNHDFAHQAADGATHIYFALNPPYHKWPELFPPLQTSVLQAAIATGAKLIVMENLYAYGRTHGKPMTEDLPLSAEHKKGIVRAQMTGELLDAQAAGTVHLAIGRASDFFGPGVLESAMGERVFYPAVHGKSAQVIGKLDMPHTHTYIPDVGKALVILGEHDEALGKVWHIPSPPARTQHQFIEKVYAACGHPTKITAAPKLLLRIVGLFNPIVRELLGTLYQFEEPFVMDSSRFETTFGMQATPLDDAIRETVAWFRANPKAV